MDLLTGIRGGRRRRHRRDEPIECFELDPTKKARSCSRGNRQKVVLVAGLSAEAELYVLDEPASGLDPLMEARFADEVRRLSGQGSTVLFSGHILAEAEKLCDTVTIIRAGRDVESGTLAELRHLTRSAVTATTSVGPGRLRGLPGVHHLEHDDGRPSFDVGDCPAPAALRRLPRSTEGAPPDGHRIGCRPGAPPRRASVREEPPRRSGERVSPRSASAPPG